MKTWIRRIAVAAFVLSFAPIVPRIGKLFAQVPPQDITFTNSTKSHITYETANATCLPGPNPVISCNEPYLDSDSYSINAGIDVTSQYDLDTDLTNNGLMVSFWDGDCDTVFGTSFPLFFQAIPGNQMHVTHPKGGKWKTIYAFEGNVPNTFQGTYDHMEMNLMVNRNDPTKSVLHIEANADLCDWSNNPQYGTPLSAGQPVSMYIDITGTEGAPYYIPGATPNDLDGDWYGDQSCVNLTPSYSMRDITPAACIGP